MDDDEHDWLDDEMLRDDKAQRAWQRRAVGMPVTEALLAIPKRGQINLSIPIAAHRAFREMLDRKDLPAEPYIRRAVREALANDDYPPEHLQAWLE